MTNPPSRRDSIAPAPATVLAVAGDVTMTNAADLKRSLDEALGRAGTGVVLDLSAAAFMDSSALSALVTAYSAASDAGKALVLAGLQPPVRALLDLTRLNEVFTVYLSATDALADLDPTARAA